MSDEYSCPSCGLVGPEACGSNEDMQDCPHADTMQSGPLAGLKIGHYGAILADPPWSFLTRSDAGKDRSPENHYNCMTLDEIKAMPVQRIAAKNCALFMWVIDTHLPMALDVMKAWGFEHKTRAFVWTKLNKKYADYDVEMQQAHEDRAWFKGMGFWTRANPEDCLLATRGAPKRQNKAVRRLLVAPVREHSRKPDETHTRIETLVNGPYCELFARESRPGWDQMGNEVSKFDPIDALETAEIEDLI
jgi:N6-adenosine-specific RNA methylase IME4